MLNKKSEVFSKFKSFKAKVENQIGRKIKCLLTDNGGEFFSLEFDQFCVDHGIRQIKIVSYTPQENGAAERLNQTISERARCMLSNAGLERNSGQRLAATPIQAISTLHNTQIW